MRRVDSKRGGAGLVQMLSTSTMHRDGYESIERFPFRVPFCISPIRPATHCVRRASNESVLLGTRYTMEPAFYTGTGCASALAWKTLVPEEAQRADVHRVICDELCHGSVKS